MQKIFILTAFVLLSYIFFKNENILLLCAGIAIFIFGVVIMGDGFKSSSGGTLEKFLHKHISTKIKSILFGVISTTLMQSSTLISLVTISFLSAGLIELAQGIGIIFGSQIGTTSGAWLVAGFGVSVDIEKYAMPVIIFGIILLLQSDKKIKSLGQVLTGIGLLFLGVAYIKDGFEAIGNDFNLAQYSIDGIKGILVFFAIGMLIAVVTQSSLATIVLTIAALSAEQISYQNALGIVIGANLGTTFTALVSSIGSNIEGKRLVFVYLLFNVILSILSIIFIKQFAALVNYEAIIFGISSDNYGLKLAIFHSTINIIMVFTLYPFIDKISALSQKIIKRKIGGIDEEDDVLYINNSSINHENAMKEVVRKEICHLYSNASKIMTLGIHTPLSAMSSNLSPHSIINSCDTLIDFDYEELYQKRIKKIYGKIINFIIIAQSNTTNENVIKELADFQKAALCIVEALKDVKHLQKNMKKHMSSQNIDIKNGYSQIRENLFTQLKILNKIFEESTNAPIHQTIEHLENLREKFDKNAGRLLGSLLKSDKISPLIGTSLINDNSYTYQISGNLIEASKLIFAH
ncbi:MAG: Na/Pi symporter [Campylobacteraceae bacterium]|nr:Na/Pi symporter [Campylobacteraceae bacterium]